LFNGLLVDSVRLDHRIRPTMLGMRGSRGQALKLFGENDEFFSKIHHLLYSLIVCWLTIASCPQASGGPAEEAKQLYWEGHRLQEEATKESLLKAIEKYKQALLLFQQVGDIFNQAETLSSMGKT